MLFSISRYLSAVPSEDQSRGQTNISPEIGRRRKVERIVEVVVVVVVDGKALISFLCTVKKDVMKIQIYDSATYYTNKSIYLWISSFLERAVMLYNMCLNGHIMPITLAANKNQDLLCVLSSLPGSFLFVS